MNDLNLQITEQRSFLFSLVHANTNYDFISLWQIYCSQQSQMFCCQIYPLNINKQKIRISSHSLKIQLNRFLLSTNFNISSTGFKFKLHPIKGTFFLQYSYLSCEKIHNSQNAQQKNQCLQNHIMSKINKSKIIKELFIKMLKLNEDGSSLENKQNDFNRLLKYSYNSKFYAWISPNKQKLVQIKKVYQTQQNAHNKTKELEVWSDCSSDDEENFYDKDDQTNQSFYKKIQTLQNPKKSSFSDFYHYYRSQYNKISPFDQNQIKKHQNQERLASSNTQHVIKFFMSQQNDIQMYQKYIEKHVQAAYQTELKRKMKTKEKQKQNLMFFARMYNQIGISKNQIQWQSNLVSFIESNNLTLSKSSKWKIIMNIISKVYEDFISNRIKQRCEYLDMRMYKIEKKLQVSLRARKDELGFLIMPQMKNSSDESFDSKSESDLIQDFFKKQEQQQKNIASIMLDIACLVCVPQVKFVNRRFYKSLQMTQTKFQMQNIKSISKKVSMQGQFQKFKSTNTSIQSILFYFHQKVMKYNKGPFGDWVIILCENINEIFQKSPLFAY